MIVVVINGRMHDDEWVLFIIMDNYLNFYLCGCQIGILPTYSLRVIGRWSERQPTRKKLKQKP